MNNGKQKKIFFLIHKSITLEIVTIIKYYYLLISKADSFDNN